MVTIDSEQFLHYERFYRFPTSSWQCWVFTNETKINLQQPLKANKYSIQKYEVYMTW